MKVDIACGGRSTRMRAPRIFTEIGNEEQIHSAVRNAIRNGVRDGMVQFSINDMGKRNLIATTMGAEVDSALVTQPRGGGPPFRIASVTAFFLRDLQPPAQVIQAINSKIAQEQQIQTERHRVEVARLQAEQQRLLNQTLTPEALTKQYLEVLQEMRTSNNLVILVPTEGGLPVLNMGEMRRNLAPALMAAPLVTITRQYASGGSDIASLAAMQLGWTLIDNEFVEAVARRAGLPLDEVAQREERAPGLLERLARTLAVASPECSSLRPACRAWRTTRRRSSR